MDLFADSGAAPAKAAATGTYFPAMEVGSRSAPADSSGDEGSTPGSAEQVRRRGATEPPAYVCVCVCVRVCVCGARKKSDIAIPVVVLYLKKKTPCLVQGCLFHWPP